MSENASHARSTTTLSIRNKNNYTTYCPHGHSLSGEWTSSAPSHPARASKIPNRSRWLFYQMDRSQATDHHHGPASPAVCVERHYMQIWCTTYHHNRQWPTIYRQEVSQILHRPRHQTHHKLCRTSTNQWASRSGKLSYSHRATQEVGYRQRPMAWRVNRSTWAYRCTPQSSTNESSFSLVYGADAMIPVEIGEPSLRRELYDPTQNHQNMALHLDLLPELREKAQYAI